MSAATGQLQVFYDGACPLCRREAAHYQKRDRDGRILWIDIARPDFHAAAFGLDPVRVQQVMHARDPDGHIYTELRAFVKIWECLPGFLPFLLRTLFKIPGTLLVGGVLYRAFARNRYRLTGRCTPESCNV
jgi:predicted DCC family thiol-disulfide oxidoreductase YuxK